MYQTLVLINYAEGEKYVKFQEENIYDYGPYVDRAISYNRSILPTDFMKKNWYILSQRHSVGNALWKPFIILNALTNSSLVMWGDVILYMDVEDKVTKPDAFFSYVRRTMEFERDQFLVRNVHRNSDWTKRDCFIKMDCDFEKYWWVSQLEAGICAFRKTKFNIDLVKEWLEFGQDPDIMTDDKSIYGSDLPGFQQSRCDQSVLTNLQVKYGLPVVPIQEILPMVTYNGKA